ncbi:unnamed protein product [Dibothriocephalus latus]|uniref:Uncharacterized protein n=1 Tax=Dibothriocephalus latus TaxID=60516 RepID=A0A3P6QR78_DIBLA|nr:unnamed protein product [Dibothriocephalus latus]
MLYGFVNEQIAKLTFSPRSFSPGSCTAYPLRMTPYPDQTSQADLGATNRPLADRMNHILSTMLYAREVLHSLRLVDHFLNQLVNVSPYAPKAS